MDLRSWFTRVVDQFSLPIRSEWLIMSPVRIVWTAWKRLQKLLRFKLVGILPHLIVCTMRKHLLKRSELAQSRCLNFQNLNEYCQLENWIHQIIFTSNNFITTKSRVRIRGTTWRERGLSSPPLDSITRSSSLRALFSDFRFWAKWPSKPHFASFLGNYSINWCWFRLSCRHHFAKFRTLLKF